MMNSISDNYIAISIEMSKCVDLREVPVVAVFVNTESNQHTVYYNRVYTDKDPTAHAEIIGIRDLCKSENLQRLDNYDIFVNLEPCVMCAQAISNARIRKLYFAAYDSKSGGVESGAALYYQKSCHYKPEFYGGIMEKEASAVFSDYFKKLRQNKVLAFS